jgi:PAS domain-containing protein
MRLRFPLAAALLLTALPLLQACSKSGSDAPATSLADAQNPANAAEQIRQRAEAERQAQLPKADPATPASAYVALSSGEQLMYLYYAVSGLPLPLDELAEQLSRDYRATQDQFRRQDILKALEPRIRAAVDAAKQQRYVIWEADGQVIEAYDFARKQFPVNEGYWKGNSSSYFTNLHQYQISFQGPLQALPVADEAQARLIEEKRSKYQPMRLRVYAFVQDADLNQKQLKSQPLKLELLDGRGTVLARHPG